LTAADILAGFQLTGYFLERHVFQPRAVAMPQARAWLYEGLTARIAA